MTALTPELLLQAYAMGVFPMAEHRVSEDIAWVDPLRRGVIPLERFHVSRSLRKRLLKDNYTVKLNRDFAGCVAACADRPETWINGEIFRAYVELHRLGHAHSLEIWQNDEMIGGVYGVTLGGGILRREHVLAPRQWLEDRARLAGGAAAVRRLRAL
jgi:leucyl/phenylalanyl-tRNA--protein transferase